MPTAPDPMTAVLLIAHGSRRVEANADLEELARRVTEQGGYAIVEVSYLELATPTIADGGRRCVSRGASRVLMLPYFLSAGRHVTEHLLEHQRQLAEEFPAVAFQPCPPLGLHPLMTQIVLDRLTQSEIERSASSLESSL
ncbi:MAG: CbiX/SirB N-terminal domain-containing protein [Planctomycetaceae bacterium]|nr:CbiX/SirB N-terminal domain-containing protein [Planctomycetaceae bacterium]